MKLKLEAFCKLLIYIYILKGLKDNSLYIYAEMSHRAKMNRRGEMLYKIDKMIMETMLDENLIKTKMFYPYTSYRESILIQLTQFEEQTEDNKGFCMFESGEGVDLIFDPLEEELMKRANLIFKEDRQTFLKIYESGWEYMNEATIGGGEEDWGDEESFIRYFLNKMATIIITKNRLFQYKFNNILLQLEEDYKKEVLEKIAFEKIKRNKLFILGISMKVSMRDCGELIEAY